ncbi:MAG: zinc metallopeptidase [Clostridia bacterium]
MGSSLLANNGLNTLVSVALIIVGILIIVASLWAGIARIKIFTSYNKFNKIENQSGLTGETAALLLLDRAGLTDVKVKPLGFFRMLMYGNSYSLGKKTIYLRKNIFNKTSITAVGLAVQKVGLAIMHQQKDKKLKARSIVQPLIVFAPVMFIPISIMGFLIDLFLFNMNGISSLIGVAIASVLYIAAFVFVILNIPVEKKANTIAMDIMTQTNFLTQEERSDISVVFKAYISAYVADFVISILYIIQFILKGIAKLLNASK